MHQKLQTLLEGLSRSTDPTCKTPEPPAQTTTPPASPPKSGDRLKALFLRKAEQGHLTQDGVDALVLEGCSEAFLSAKHADIHRPLLSEQVATGTVGHKVDLETTLIKAIKEELCKGAASWRQAGHVSLATLQENISRLSAIPCKPDARSFLEFLFATIDTAGKTQVGYGDVCKFFEEVLATSAQLALNTLGVERAQLVQSGAMTEAGIAQMQLELWTMQRNVRDKVA